MTGTVPLGPGREFDAIRALTAAWGPRAQDIGDDAAIINVPDGEQLVASTDTSVEHVHFRRDWLTPEEIGWRATTAALSDLAAMGARPLGMLLALTVPAAWRSDLPAIGRGIGDAAAAAGCVIRGGDMSVGEALSIGITALGACRAPTRRSGARAGDDLWVTGALGGPARALRAWLAGAAPDAQSRERFAHPEARLEAGVWLAAHGATAIIDISDGLVADARHLAAASAVSLTIVLENLPLFSGASPRVASESGEEYELLVSAPASLDPAAFTAACGVALTRIGAVSAGTGVTVLEYGARVEIVTGYDHFSG